MKEVFDIKDTFQTNEVYNLASLFLQTMADDDDIAIVGVGCRFPGADNLQEFWQVLVNGENHVTDIPPERWNNDFHFSEDKDAQGKMYVKKAGLLKK